MSNPPSSDDAPRQLEEIVAYLDGELSPQESAQVERRLAADEAYRQQLQSLERTWTALDELPGTTVDDQFSKTTMELVVQSARSDLDHRTQAIPLERRRLRLSTFMLAVAAALFGALVYRLAWEDPNRALVADLPVIQYIDVYSQFQEVDFLRQLQRQLGDKAWALDEEDDQSADELEQFQLISAADARETWLESLPANERVTLRAKFNLFGGMTEEQQDRHRALHAQIESDPDSAELQRTMLEYQQWLNGLAPSQQYELRGLPLEERVRKVVQMVQAAKKSFDLTPEELQDLYRAVGPRWREMSERMRENMSRRGRGDGGPGSGRGDPFSFLEENLPEFRELNRDIREAIPQEKREQFDQLTPRQQWQQIFGWMRRAVRPRAGGRRSGDRDRSERISEQELERFFVEELDAATKERLLAMPLDKMQHRLRQYYFYEGNLPMRNWEPPPGEQRDRRPPGPPPDIDSRRREGPPVPRERRGDPPFERHPPDRRPRFREGPPE